MLRLSSLATILVAAVAAGVPLATAVAQAPPPAAAPAPAADTTITVKFGAFVDSYYAYDFGRPVTFDRGFTTQAARHNEFNVNLAYVEALVNGSSVRGRLALQAGTSVMANYAGEPHVGSVSGPSLARHIQEAYVGVKVAKDFWIDGGIFYSNIGVESWASKDNPTYTRSLVADFTPYYSAGVKATWQATPRLSARIDLVNGWQNISENNADKAIGLRLDYAASATSTLSYYNFAGTETDGRFRFFNGVGLKAAPVEKVQILGNFDYGTQGKGSGASGSSAWYGASLMLRYAASSNVALVGRGEFYDDKDQVIVVTGLPDPFQVFGGSIGVDWTLVPRAAWRTELRGLNGKHAVFADRDGSNGLSNSNVLLVTSLSVTF